MGLPRRLWRGERGREGEEGLRRPCLLCGASAPGALSSRRSPVSPAPSPTRAAADPAPSRSPECGCSLGLCPPPRPCRFILARTRIPAHGVWEYPRRRRQPSPRNEGSGGGFGAVSPPGPVAPAAAWRPGVIPGPKPRPSRPPFRVRALGADARFFARPCSVPALAAFEWIPFEEEREKKGSRGVVTKDKGSGRCHRGPVFTQHPSPLDCLVPGHLSKRCLPVFMFVF